MFNMSSLTDIIFLLLIFFMLTSSLVAPNSLNLKMPGKSQKKVTTDSKTDDIKISKSGQFYFNGRRTELAALDSQLTSMTRGRATPLVITISPDKDTPVEHVVAIMDIALRLEIDAVLATNL